MFTYSKHDHILPYSNDNHALLVHTSRKPTVDDWEESVIKPKVSEEPEHHNLISLSLHTPKIGGKSVKMSECRWEHVKLYMSQNMNYLSFCSIDGQILEKPDTLYSKINMVYWLSRNFI